MARVLSSDPYRNYKFKIKFDNDTVAAVNSVTGISKSVEVISYEGDFSTPGLSSFEPVTLSQGITQNRSKFHDWVLKINEYSDDLRKDVTIELCNEKGEVKLGYKLLNCWVSEYQLMPALSSEANEIAIKTISLQHEGFIKQ